MRLCKLKQAAAVGAVVLGFAMSGSSAWAVCATGTAGTIDAQDPFQIQLCAQVENTFTTAVDDVNFGNIGVTGWTGESGCLIMDTDGTFDESNAACLGSYGAAPVIARVVAEDSAGAAVPGTPGEIQITGAFPEQEIRMWFQAQVTTNEIPPTAPTTAVPASLWYTQLVAEVPAGGDGTQTQAGLWTIDPADAPEAPADLTVLDTSAQNDVADATGGTFKADTEVVTGDLTIAIGATIQTDGTFAYDPAGPATGSLYESGAYEGAFEVVLFY